MKVEVYKTLGKFEISARFELNGAGISALFGPSGAGKTSIINMIAGLIKPEQGLIKIGDSTLFDSKSRVNIPPYKRRIGYIFQDGRLFPHMSVSGNLKYGRNLIPEDKRYISLEDVVKVLDIEGLLKRRPHNLSGGEKQRAAIGRALLSSPRLLLMDEPLTSVDNSRKNAILKMIGAIPDRFKIPVLYVSHSAEELDALSAEIISINNGKTYYSPQRTVHETSRV